MKPWHFIPPVAVLISGIAWLAARTREITRLEEGNSILSERISTPLTSTGDSPQKTARTSPTSQKSPDPIDWKAVAAQLADMQRGGIGDIRAATQLQQRIRQMSADEILAALDEIASSDFPAETRLSLEQMLLGPLIEKDPQLALDRFLPRIDENRGIFAWQLSAALRQWAKKDLPAATAWFDTQIASGRFDSKSLDGRNSARQHFESSLIAALLPSDPDAAARRLDAVPPQQRRDILSHYELQALNEADQANFASLVRAYLPENEQTSVIAGPANRLASGGYEKIGPYLDRIAATPAERAAAVETAAGSRINQLSRSRKITATDIDQLRQWAETQSPGSADKATGRALANLDYDNGSTTFDQAAELAATYHESSSSDDLLATFLESWSARSNKETARSLAAKISDPQRREKILSNLR